MDFLGLVWVASFLNQDSTALVGMLEQDEPIGHFVEEFPLSTSPSKFALEQSLLANLGEPETLHESSFLLPKGIDPTQTMSPAPSKTLLMQGSSQLEGVFSFLDLPALPEFPVPTSDSVPAPMSADTFGTQATLSGYQSDVNFDAVEALLTPRLPKLSKDLVNWAAWNSVADIEVVPLKDKEKPKSKPDFLKLRGQCPAFSTVVDRDDPKAAPISSPKMHYQIWVHDVPVGEVKTADAAYHIAGNLRRLLQLEDWHPSQLKPLLGNSFAAGRVNDDILFVVDESMLPGAAASSALVASQWINNLRVAFGEKPLELSDVQMAAYGLRETRRQFEGTASWYGPYFHGRKTATGEIFDQNDLTAAHPSLPFGTYLKVRNVLNGKTIVVRVNDRGPYVGTRSLDLSYAAAQCLGSDKVGVIPYEATILKPGIPDRWQGSLIARLDR